MSKKLENVVINDGIINTKIDRLQTDVLEIKQLIKQHDNETKQIAKETEFIKGFLNAIKWFGIPLISSIILAISYLFITQPTGG